MNLHDDDFTLFQLAPRMALDTDELAQRWRALQRQAHPDRFATQGAAAQRLAMQWSVRINEAYQRLKNPIQRAAYLCERHGHPVATDSHTTMPPEFLMRQMELREQLDEARTAQDLDALAAHTAQLTQNMLTDITRQIDEESDWAAAAQNVRALMFLDKLASDIARQQSAGHLS